MLKLFHKTMCIHSKQVIRIINGGFLKILPALSRCRIKATILWCILIMFVYYSKLNSGLKHVKWLLSSRDIWYQDLCLNKPYLCNFIWTYSQITRVTLAHIFVGYWVTAFSRLLRAAGMQNAKIFLIKSQIISDVYSRWDYSRNLIIRYMVSRYFVQHAKL